MERSPRPAQKRIPALDIAKALSIICMVFIHIFEVTAENNAIFVQNIASSGFRSFLAALLEFAGGVISGGAFIFIMGFLVGFSRSGSS